MTTMNELGEILGALERQRDLVGREATSEPPPMAFLEAIVKAESDHPDDEGALSAIRRALAEIVDGPAQA